VADPAAAPFFDASYQQLANGPWLSRGLMPWFFHARAPKLVDMKR
jgi:hypothetical protein